MTRPTEVEVRLYDPRGRDEDFWEFVLSTLLIEHDTHVLHVETEEV